MSAIYPTRFSTFLPIFSVAFFVLMLMSCTGYQSVSYYQDGIYGDAKAVAVQQNEVVEAQPNSSGTYYKSYFDQKAADGIQDDYIFTDIDQYQNDENQQTNAGNYQAHGSWGDQADRINVNIIYNRSPYGWGWYNAPFNFGRSSFWGYNYHPWYFPYDNFYNPYYYPYGFGWGPRWRYRNPWNYGNYWNRHHNWHYTNPPTYSRLNGGRAIPRANLTNRGTSNRQGVTTSTSTSTRSNTRTTSASRRGYINRNNQRYNESENGTRNQEVQQNTSGRSYSTNQSNSRNNSYRRSSSSSSNNYRSAPSSSRSSSTRSSSSSRSSRSSSSRRR